MSLFSQIIFFPSHPPPWHLALIPASLASTAASSLLRNGTGGNGEEKREKRIDVSRAQTQPRLYGKRGRRGLPPFLGTGGGGSGE